MPVTAARLKTNPYLHVFPDRIYNPLTDRTLLAGEPLYRALESFRETGIADEGLVREGWVIAEDDDLSRRHLLKIVSKARSKVVTSRFAILRVVACLAQELVSRQ